MILIIYYPFKYYKQPNTNICSFLYLNSTILLPSVFSLFVLIQGWCITDIGSFKLFGSDWRLIFEYSYT